MDGSSEMRSSRACISRSSSTVSAPLSFGSKQGREGAWTDGMRRPGVGQVRHIGIADLRTKQEQYKGKPAGPPTTCAGKLHIRFNQLTGSAKPATVVARRN